MPWWVLFPLFHQISMRPDELIEIRDISLGLDLLHIFGSLIREGHGLLGDFQLVQLWWWGEPWVLILFCVVQGLSIGIGLSQLANVALRVDRIHTLEELLLRTVKVGSAVRFLLWITGKVLSTLFVDRLCLVLNVERHAYSTSDHLPEELRVQAFLIVTLIPVNQRPIKWPTRGILRVGASPKLDASETLEH